MKPIPVPLESSITGRDPWDLGDLALVTAFNKSSEVLAMRLGMAGDGLVKEGLSG